MGHSVEVLITTGHDGYGQEIFPFNRPSMSILN